MVKVFTKTFTEFTLWVVFQVGVMPDCVRQLPPAPQVSWDCISDPPGLKTEEDRNKHKIPRHDSSNYSHVKKHLVKVLQIYCVDTWLTYSAMFATVWVAKYQFSIPYFPFNGLMLERFVFALEKKNIYISRSHWLPFNSDKIFCSGVCSVERQRKISFPYIVNGGHQKQDDSGDVQNNDSSQHQHLGLLKTGNMGKAEGWTPLFMFSTWIHTRTHAHTQLS